MNFEYLSEFFILKMANQSESTEIVYNITSAEIEDAFNTWNNSENVQDYLNLQQINHPM